MAVVVTWKSFDQCPNETPHRPHDFQEPLDSPVFHCKGQPERPPGWEGSMTLFERDTGEKPNWACNSCPFECVDGWVEEYDSTICPDCDGLIVSKAVKKITQATVRLARRST